MSTKKKNAAKKAPEKKSTPVKKAVPVYKNFIYLMPEDTQAVEMCGALEFLPEDALEVWTEINVLEITVDNRTITFESLKEELYEEDLELLGQMSMKQIYTCEYALEDRELMQKVMQTLFDRFGGKIGSDTEDFSPFIEITDL